jgi:hypothetical protein
MRLLSLNGVVAYANCSCQVPSSGDGKIILVAAKPNDTAAGAAGGAMQHTELEQWEQKRARDAQRDHQQAKTAR